MSVNHLFSNQLNCFKIQVNSCLLRMNFILLIEDAIIFYENHYQRRGSIQDIEVSGAISIITIINSTIKNSTERVKKSDNTFDIIRRQVVKTVFPTFHEVITE